MVQRPQELGRRPRPGSLPVRLLQHLRHRLWQCPRHVRVDKPPAHEFERRVEGDRFALDGQQRQGRRDHPGGGVPPVGITRIMYRVSRQQQQLGQRFRILQGAELLAEERQPMGATRTQDRQVLRPSRPPHHFCNEGNGVILFGVQDEQGDAFANQLAHRAPLQGCLAAPGAPEQEHVLEQVGLAQLHSTLDPAGGGDRFVPGPHDQRLRGWGNGQWQRHTGLWVKVTVTPCSGSQ